MGRCDLTFAARVMLGLDIIQKRITSANCMCNGKTCYT